MNVMNLRNYILTHLPESWRIVAKELGMQTELVDRLYETIPIEYRNKHHSDDAIRMLDNILIYEDADPRHFIDATHLDYKKWDKFSRVFSIYIDFRKAFFALVKSNYEKYN